jgi:hypothetical protein
MKKILKYTMLSAVLLMLTGGFSVAYSQTEFAPIGSEWHYTYTPYGAYSPQDHFNYIVSEKDTIVEGQNCRILRRFYDGTGVINETYIIKQEQGKIFFYYQNKFHLLMDFEAQIGDTVRFTFMYDQYNYDNNLWVDTVFSARYKIENITTNIQNLKTFTTKILEEDIIELHGGTAYWSYSYSEKIGLHSEFIPVFDNVPHPTAGGYRFIRCYSDAGFSFISERWATYSLPCDYLPSTNIGISRKDEIIKVYPNPFNDHIFVQTEYRGTVTIVDISGKIIYQSVLSEGLNEISTKHFPKGIFFIRIENKNIHPFKLIKP